MSDDRTPGPLVPGAKRNQLGDLVAELGAPRDALLEDAAASGELLVARIRLLLLCFILVIQLIPGWEPRVWRIGFVLNLAAIVWALAVSAVVARHYQAWMGLASSVVDVSLVSAGLVAYLTLDEPHMAVNSRVIFEVYFLVMGCAALRYDWRASALTGLLAVVQYLGVVVYAATRWDLNAPEFAPYVYGIFIWHTVAARLVLLAAASALSTALVLRALRLRRLSTTDRLTGLHDRGIFDGRLEEEAIRARRYGRVLAVAIVDIDHFKRFNDTHGHAAGDAALRVVADVLRKSVRRTDVVSRYGGEEFALLFPETAAEEAHGKLEALRLAVASTPVLVRKAASPARLTISIGVASWPADGETAAEVVAVADARLYEAKRSGRNRVVGTPPAEARPAGRP